jgi:surface polysaccharide O-acyltransferase-like enzyme
LIGNPQTIRIENKQRCYYIDWLRVLAIFAVFLFHCARFFDQCDWHIKNGSASILFSVLTGFIHQWAMPLFFLLSGAATWFVLDKKSSRHYMLGRFKRLIIPFIFGVILFIPPQKYLEAIFNQTFAGSFFYFLPFYILHQTIILIVGYSIIKLSMTVFLKFLLIVL